MAHSVGVEEDSYLDYTHFVNIVKLLEKKQVKQYCLICYVKIILELWSSF